MSAGLLIGPPTGCRSKSARARAGPCASRNNEPIFGSRGGVLAVYFKMTDAARGVSRWSGRDLVALAARCTLGGVFVYMGLTKALHPVDFLKLLRQYEMIDNHLMLNLIAAALPWFEVVCGGLLLSGIAVRGSALMSLAMLVPFTLIVLNRALAIH